jgi:hypothetical protein
MAICNDRTDGYMSYWKCPNCSVTNHSSEVRCACGAEYKQSEDEIRVRREKAEAEQAKREKAHSDAIGNVIGGILGVVILGGVIVPLLARFRLDHRQVY